MGVTIVSLLLGNEMVPAGVHYIYAKLFKMRGTT
jgi:hypothetical protein